jgi:DNA primase
VVKAAEGFQATERSLTVGFFAGGFAPGGVSMSSVDDAKNRILSRVPLADLIGDSISPRRQSGRIVGLCPFHEERSPSFHIFDDHYHCFGCRAHGDAISYVQNTQGLGFIESLRWLGGKFGIEVPELDRPDQNQLKFSQQANRAKILVSAQDFFRQSLSSPAGEASRQYLTSRGFDDADIVEFGFGYAPAGQNKLVHKLLSQGFQFEDLKDCSLANGHPGKAFDFFQDRIMIPIRDVQSRLIAFGGRTMGGEPQKYKNSRYDKGHVLFGMDRARKVMATKSRAIVVEGYMDVLQMWRFGFEETVACQGTALTVNHMKLLNNATSLVYLMFDGDSAGQGANLKLIEDALDFAELEFRVVLLSEKDDPDSFLRQNGAEGMERAIANSMDLIDFGITRKLDHASKTGIPEIVSKELVGWLAKIENKIKQEYLIDRLAEKSGVHKDALRSAVHGGPKKQRAVIMADVVEPKETPVSAELSPIAKELLGHLYYARPDEINFEQVTKFLCNDLRAGDLWEGFALEMIGVLQAGSEPSLQDFGGWSFAQFDSAADVLHWIRDSHAAFSCADRPRRISKLQLVHRRKYLEKSVSYLKDRLTTLPTDLNADQNEWQEIVRAVAQLNSELKTVQQQLIQ